MGVIAGLPTATLAIFFHLKEMECKQKTNS